MPCFDLQILIHERSCHVFWIDIQGQNTPVGQIYQQLMPPTQDFCCGGGGKGFERFGWASFCGIEKSMVPEKNSQRQVPTDQRTQVLLHLHGIDFIDHVADHHNQGSFQAVGPQIKESLVIP